MRKGIVALCAAAMTMGLTGAASAAPPTLEDAAVSAYAYTYPLVSVELTRRQSTAIVPMNQPANMPFLPDATFTKVVRPNVDTLYTSMFFDVSKEPVVIGVPDMGSRYHLFQIMDMWTDVAASVGPRTLGEVHGYEFALVGPNWRGTLPAGVQEYRVPTDAGWLLGRIQVNGTEDLPNAVAVQEKLSVKPLSGYGTPSPALREAGAGRSQSVSDVIHQLSPQQYWDLYYASLSHDQPRPEDKRFLAQMARFGWSPYKKLDLGTLPAATRATWESAWPKALSQITGDIGGDLVNGWNTPRTGMGNYGTDYLFRANIAFNALAANLPEDAVYSSTRVDAQGARLTAGNSYVLRLPAEQIPPVTGFWSLTLYNERGFFVDNPADRYAVRGERLTKNADGSVEILIQAEHPGAEREANWLPAPTSGEFSLMIRAYWPKA